MGKRPRVVIADDERSSRVYMKSLLESMNCEVVGEAGDGVEAVHLYKTLKPHLIILDLNMPRKKGDQALEEILADFPDAFIIIVSAITDSTLVSKCLSMGAANYIRKDTPVLEIKSIIKDTWNERVSKMDQ